MYHVGTHLACLCFVFVLVFDCVFCLSDWGGVDLLPGWYIIDLPTLRIVYIYRIVPYHRRERRERGEVIYFSRKW